MKIPEDGWLLRIHIGESDKWHGQPLFEAIVIKARELHMAGATVLRGPMGFGAHSRMHTTKILQLSEDLPIVIEIVDSREKIDEFLPHIDTMVREGLVTLEKVRVIKSTARMGRRNRLGPPGGVTEWPKVPVLKTGRPARVSGVRIPSPPLCSQMNLPRCQSGR